MNIYSIIALLIFATNSVQAFEYQEQTLSPMQSLAETTASSRLLAPKQKTYPFLDQLEASLYPNRNFKQDKPGERLERIEIAVFGKKQSGSISNRLENLQAELNNWQIGNMKTVKNIEANNKKEKIAYQHYNNPQIIPRQAFNVQRQASPKDYDYMNYRMATPLVQNIGRRAIDAIFK